MGSNPGLSFGDLRELDAFADLRELASNSHDFPRPVPCPALPDLSELAVPLLAVLVLEVLVLVPLLCPGHCPRAIRKIHICLARDHLPLPLPLPEFARV